MQDLVLQYLKKTVLRPRAIGKSEFLGGLEVIVHCLFEGKGFAFIPAILSGMKGRLPPPLPLFRWPCNPTILVFHTTYYNEEFFAGGRSFTRLDEMEFRQNMLNKFTA